MSLKPSVPRKDDPGTWPRGFSDWDSVWADYKKVQAAYEADPAAFNGHSPLSYKINGTVYTAPRGMSLKDIESAISKKDFAKFNDSPAGMTHADIEAALAKREPAK